MPFCKLDRQQHFTFCAGYAPIFMLNCDGHRHANPDLASFDNAEEFYSTLFHELTHATGHPLRLNRATLTEFERFGDEQYSAEELVAEMGAAFLCGFTGIENKTIDNSAAYLRTWLEVLRKDPRLVLIAAGQAQRAADLILNQPASASERCSTPPKLCPASLTADLCR